jgi:Flp pilus assembly protein TadG
MGPARRRRTRFLPHSAQNGTAAVEFALLAPLLLILLTGVIEIGMGVFQDMQVQAAAEAGALYAAKYGSGNLTAIGLAVTNATSTSGITASPAPAVFCGCPTTSGITSQGSNCTTVCSSGKLPGTYVKVSATITRTELLLTPYISLGLPATFTGQSVVRVQ